jgi:hypothetical protein
VLQILDSKDHGQELKSITDGGNARTRADVALQIICSRVANFGNQRFSVSKGKVRSKLNFKDKCEHLLHCVYLSLVIDQNEPPTFGSKGAAANKNLESSGALASASQLRKAGIDFRGRAGT